MKKALLLLVVATGLGVAHVNAQTERGTYLLGGGASFTSTDDVSTFNFNPNIGYFVANNFAVGALANLYFAKGDNSYAVGPFARYYFGGKGAGTTSGTTASTATVGGKFFGQAGINVGGGKNSDTDLGVGLGLGYALFLNRSIALETAAYYDRTGDDKNTFRVSVGFQIHLSRVKL
jgi:hypothetical protein